MAPAIGILNEDVVTLNQIVTDPGKITITEKFSTNDPGFQRDYVCWTYKDTNAGHGDVDFYKGVYESCDVYWYKVGGGYPGEVEQGLGIWRISEYARALGYGARTGIELPGEASGLMPDPTWKRINVGENWSTGDTYIATMGQGYVLSTPLQVLVSFATLANDGKRMQSTLVREVLDSEGNIVKPFQPKLQVDITKTPVISLYDERSRITGEKITVEPWVIQEAQEGMRQVVTLGTSKVQFEGETIPSAGKTGTAEYCDDIANKQNLCLPGRWPAHAWYAGYAPYDNPEIAVVAFVYNGKEGSTVSAPIVRRIMEAYFELKAVDAARTPTGQ
jgi:penicillin-binding protein 2